MNTDILVSKIKEYSDKKSAGINTVLLVDETKDGALYFKYEDSGQAVDMSTVERQTAYGLYGTSLQIIFDTLSEVGVGVFAFLISPTSLPKKDTDALITPHLMRQCREATLKAIKKQATKEDTQQKENTQKGDTLKLECLKVYRTKEPGKPERMTHFEILSLSNNRTQKLSREQVDKLLLNPNAQDQENYTDRFIQGEKLIKGISYNRWTPKGSNKTTWHLRVNPSIEQIIAYGEGVTYSCTDVWKELTPEGKLGKITKYRIVNEATNEESFISRTEVWELITNPYAIEGKNGSDTYIKDKVHGLRVDYYKDPSTNKSSWRLRPTKDVKVHSESELSELNKTLLERANSIRCTKAYGVTIPTSEPMNSTKRAKTIYTKYELQTPDGLTFEKTTKEILELMSVPSQTGSQAKSAEKFDNLKVVYSRANDSWQLRLTPDRPEIIKIPYEEWKAEVGDTTVTKAISQLNVAKQLSKEDKVLQNGGRVIRIAYIPNKGRVHYTKFAYVTKESDTLQVMDREELKEFILSHVGGELDTFEKASRKLVYGVNAVRKAVSTDPNGNKVYADNKEGLTIGVYLDKTVQPPVEVKALDELDDAMSLGKLTEFGNLNESRNTGIVNGAYTLFEVEQRRGMRDVPLSTVSLEQASSLKSLMDRLFDTVRPLFINVWLKQSVATLGATLVVDTSKLNEKSLTVHLFFKSVPPTGKTIDEALKALAYIPERQSFRIEVDTDNREEIAFCLLNGLIQLFSSNNMFVQKLSFVTLHKTARYQFIKLLRTNIGHGIDSMIKIRGVLYNHKSSNGNMFPLSVVEECVLPNRDPDQVSRLSVVFKEPSMAQLIFKSHNDYLYYKEMLLSPMDSQNIPDIRQVKAIQKLILTAEVFGEAELEEVQIPIDALESPLSTFGRVTPLGSVPMTGLLGDFFATNESFDKTFPTIEMVSRPLVSTFLEKIGNQMSSGRAMLVHFKVGETEQTQKKAVVVQRVPGDILMVHKLIDGSVTKGVQLTDFLDGSSDEETLKLWVDLTNPTRVAFAVLNGLLHSYEESIAPVREIKLNVGIKRAYIIPIKEKVEEVNSQTIKALTDVLSAYQDKMMNKPFSAPATPEDLWEGGLRNGQPNRVIITSQGKYKFKVFYLTTQSNNQDKALYYRQFTGGPSTISQEQLIADYSIKNEDDLQKYVLNCEYETLGLVTYAGFKSRISKNDKEPINITEEGQKEHTEDNITYSYLVNNTAQAINASLEDSLSNVLTVFVDDWTNRTGSMLNEREVGMVAVLQCTNRNKTSLKKDIYVVIHAVSGGQQAEIQLHNVKSSQPELEDILNSPLLFTHTIETNSVTNGSVVDLRELIDALEFVVATSFSATITKITKYCTFDGTGTTKGTDTVAVKLNMRG